MRENKCKHLKVGCNLEGIQKWKWNLVKFEFCHTFLAKRGPNSCKEIGWVHLILMEVRMGSFLHKKHGWLVISKLLFFHIEKFITFDSMDGFKWSGFWNVLSCEDFRLAKFLDPNLFSMTKLWIHEHASMKTIFSMIFH